MPVAHADTPIQLDAPIPTWFGVGGRADRLARPRSPEEVAALAREFEAVRVLGDGANLLVDDPGVDGLVLSLSRLGAVAALDPRDPGLLRAQAGADLPRLVVSTVREGLGGLEGLGGIPATVGGAIVMNAGGAFGQIADAVARVHALRPVGPGAWEPATLERSEIDFRYRHSGLRGWIILWADLRLTPGDPERLRERLKDVMAYKKRSQPMAERSAGCVFKNPELPSGERVSAGRLIDECGLKGLRVGGASVSPVHANFLVTDRGPDGAPRASARDLLGLMDEVRRRVHEMRGVRLEPEVVVWRRGETP